MIDKNEKTLEGLPVSEGISIAKPYFLIKGEDLIPAYKISEEEVKSEINRYRVAISNSEKDLRKLQTSLKQENSYEAVDILNSHLELLQDPVLTSEIEKRTIRDCKNIESVFQSSIIELKTKFMNIEDSFFQEKIRDIIDVSRRILYHLRPSNNIAIKMIPLKSIIVATELVPSDIAEISDGQIKALVTESGGATSHSAIIARSKRIPYVTGVDVLKIQQENVEVIIVDGTNGKVILNPTEKTRLRYEKIASSKQVFFHALSKDHEYETKTLDGTSIKVFGNIDSVDEVDLVLKYNSAGVGLFRSEYLLLKDHKFPSEEDQFQIYKKLIKQLNPLPLVIRIFDVGGDKSQKNLNESLFGGFISELNPVLGCRAIRFLMRNPKHLKTQLRAILRASAFGKIGILVPMVSDIDELLFVRKTINSIKEELAANKINFEKDILLGCMIEVPSSAIMSDVIAKEVDFLSIGTNDLIQYVLAADRMNPSISNLYSPMHPSILRLIVNVIESAKTYNKSLILCGEVAADREMIPILLGLGIKELSVSVRHIPIIKNTIRKINLNKAKKIAESALKYTSSKGLINFIQEIKLQAKD